MSVNASALATMLAATPVIRSASLSATGQTATTQFTIAPPEVYTSRFVTSLTADITSGLRPITISVANTQPGFGSGTYSISIYDVGTEANPTNFEALEVIGGGASLNWTVVTETGWNSLTHVSGSTVVATVLTPRSIQQPLVNHITVGNTPDPHSIYLRKASFTNKGDTVVGTGGSGQFSPLSVGTDGQILTADSTQPTGIRWALPSVTGVLQHMGDLIMGGLLGVASRLGIGSLGQVLAVVQNPPFLGTPTGGPTCAATGSGGSLLNGQQYDFAYAWQTANASPDGGITMPSPITIFTATSTGVVSVQTPAAPGAGVTLIVYAALHGQTLHQQASLSPASSTSPNSVAVSSISTATAQPSLTNTSGGIGPGWANAGNVSSVGLSMPSTYTVSGSPVTGSGTLTVTEVSQSANRIHAGPATGAAAAPTFRAMAVADLPSPFTLTAEATAPDFSASGLTGATSGARFAGGTVSGAPTSGTWSVGDFIIDRSGAIQMCTVAGTPGTWAKPFPYTQSSTVPALATNGAIATAGVTAARVAPASAVVNISLQAGTVGGQVVSVINESASASTITFGASGSSNVADGTSCVIPGLTQKTFVWDTNTFLWYEQSGTSVGVMGPSGASHAAGIAPDPGSTAGTTRFLNENATWSQLTAQSASAAILTNGSTITTASVTAARVAPASAVTGIILQAGTFAGQRVTVVNESAATSTVSFAVAGTSNVANGSSEIIPGLMAHDYTWDTGTARWYMSSAQPNSTIDIAVTGGGVLISTGVKGEFRLDYGVQILGWYIYADQVGSIQFDIWQSTHAAYPPTVTGSLIGGGGTKPNLSSADHSQFVNLTNWTTALAQGTILRINVDSVTNCTRATLALQVARIS